jgi:hypothetical protein
MSEEKEPQWVEPNEGQPVDVDLGDGHTLTWTNYEGERVGGIIRHTKSPELMANQLAHAGSPEHVFPWCDGAFWIRGNKFTAKHRDAAPQWDMTGTFECPTLSPSFLCHCGDHGFVRNGKWVRA